MKKHWLGTIAAVALLVGGRAHAADLPVKAPPAAPVAAPILNWSGFYVGGHAGIAWSRDVFTFGIPDTGCDVSLCEDFRFTPSSFIGGGQVGFQSQVEKWVFGIEATWSGTHLRQTDESALFPGSFRSIKIDDIATVVARFGGTWDRTLIYAKAGYATARIGVQGVEGVISPAEAGLTADITSWRSGWTLGAGIEYMFWQNLILGVEFDFYNFAFDTKLPASFSDGIHTFQISGSNADVFAVTARLSYLFSWGKTPAAVVAKN